MPKYRVDRLDDEDGDFELPEEYTRTQKIKRGQGKPIDISMGKKPTKKRTPREGKE
jgi:hypothetical protein